MKKLVILSILGLLFSNTPLALADTNVQTPSTFSLKVGEKATVTNWGMLIELVNIDSVSTMSYPVQIRKSVQIKVTTNGGCSSNSDLRCFAEPEYSNRFTITEGNSVLALDLRIKVTSISESSATFSISTGVISSCVPRPACIDAIPRCLLPEPEGGWCDRTSPPPTCERRPACLDATPKCMIPEPAGGWCSGSVSPSTPPGPTPVGSVSGTVGVDVSSSGGNVGSVGNGVVVSGPGALLICPNGMTGSNCSVCRDGQCVPNTSPDNSDCIPPPVCINSTPRCLIPEPAAGWCHTTPVTSPPPVLNLSKGETVTSTAVIEATVDAPTYYEVRTVRSARLLFLFPVSSEITYSVNVETGARIVVDRPWWGFLAW